MSSPAPTLAWVVLAAWLGTILGLGAALRPMPVVASAPDDAKAIAAVWQSRFAAVRPAGASLWLGAPCPCDHDALRRLVAWAQSTGAELHHAPDLSGVALADPQGRLRYAGDAAALTALCGGARGLAVWWRGAPSSAPVVTVPCACGA